MKRNFLSLTVFVLAIVLTLSIAVGASSASSIVHEQFRFQPDDPGGDDNFGSNVGIDGDTAVVGAVNSGGGRGAAYIFQRRGNAWVQQAKLIASEPVVGSEFGETVAISGNTVVIGAPSDTSANGSTGAAYVFQRNGDRWTQQAKLLASDGADEDFFTASVAISGDLIVVGAESAMNSAGAAYVFKRVGAVWSEQAKLVASDSTSGASFGAGVALAANRIVVGAPGANVQERVSGAAYIFEQQDQEWSEQAKLVSSDGTDGGGFGIDVGLSGNTVVVGAFFQDTSSIPGAGAAYVFERADDGWIEKAKLSASDGASGSLFGVRLAISGSTVAVGASAFAIQPNSGGSAYVFERQANTWIETKKLVPSDGSSNDGFGAYIAADANGVLVGAELSSGTGANQGAAYLFTVRGELP